MDETKREARLTSAFVTLADTLVADYDVVDLLDTLVNVCADVLAAEAAGLLLAGGDGRLSVVASTSEGSQLVELMQLHDGGPCVDCYHSGKSVHVTDFRDVRDKWPGFVETAEEHGYHSMHAVPLRLRGTTLGALGMFRTETGELSDQDASVAQALADVATIGILHERAVRENETARQQLQGALDSRVLIEQAKGVIAHQKSVDMDVAFKTLRDYARSHGQLLRSVAEKVVHRSLVI